PKVLSYNIEKDCYEYKSILNSKETGLKEVVQVSTSQRKIKCSSNHPFLTTNGWKEAAQLRPNDLLLTTSVEESARQFYNYTDDQMSVIYGSYLGDGHLGKISKTAYRVGCTHGIQ